MEQAIFQEVHEKRYTLADKAPICQGKLHEEFGYLANTDAAEAVLAGNYTPPPGADQATTELFAEIARIRKEVPQSSSAAVTIPPVLGHSHRKAN